MATARNRRAGHDLERDVVNMLKERGWDVATARYASRMLDDSGIDIAGDYPRKLQCKAMVSTPPMISLLETTAADTVIWRKMEKRGKRFYPIGEYAFLPLEDLLTLIDKAYGKERGPEV